MATLKAGSAGDPTDSMTAMIEAAMQEEWALANGGEALPQAGEKDRLVLFAAVAKGVLRYLHKHQLFVDTTVVADQPGGHRHQLSFDLVEQVEPIEAP